MTRPGLVVMLWRAVRRRCPWCGGKGAYFTSWFAKRRACRTCGLRWRRGDRGFELGAALMASAIVLGPVIVAMSTALAITWPDVPGAPAVVGLMLAGIVLPILLYPLSYTLWQAIDLLMRPASVEDFDLDHLLDGADRDDVDNAGVRLDGDDGHDGDAGGDVGDPAA